MDKSFVTKTGEIFWDQYAHTKGLREFNLFHENKQQHDCVHADTTTYWDLWWAFNDVVGATPRGIKRCQNLKATIKTDSTFNVANACSCFESNANGKPTVENWLTAGHFIRLQIFMHFQSKEDATYTLYPRNPLGKPLERKCAGTILLDMDIKTLTAKPFRSQYWFARLLKSHPRGLGLKTWTLSPTGRVLSLHSFPANVSDISYRTYLYCS